MNSVDGQDNSESKQKVQMKDIMHDMETQGKKWMNQFQEAVVDDPLVTNIKMDDVGRVAQQVLDKASQLYTPDTIDRISQQAQGAKNQYLNYVQSFWAQDQIKEYSENDDKQLQFQKPESDMPQVPAKYTIEMDCANNTCQSEMAEDHSPAPLVKTGVIDVISKNEKYNFDKNDFKQFGKESSGLKIYHLNEGLMDANNGVQTLIYNGRNPLKFYRQNEVLYVLEPGQTDIIGQGIEPITYKEPVVLEPEMPINQDTDPVYHFNGGFNQDFDWEDHHSLPQKDVSLRDNIQPNASLLIVIILGLIIGYLLKKDNYRKAELKELQRKLNAANERNHHDQTEFSGVKSDMDSKSLESCRYNQSIKTDYAKPNRIVSAKFQNIPGSFYKEEIEEEKQSEINSSIDMVQLNHEEDTKLIKNNSKSPKPKRSLKIETDDNVLKNVLQQKLSPNFKNEPSENDQYRDEIVLNMVRIPHYASKVQNQRERTKSQGNHARMESFRSSQDSQNQMYQKIPKTSIGFKKRERIYSDPNMQLKNLNLNSSETDRPMNVRGQEYMLDVGATVVHEQIRQISNKISHADKSNDSNMPILVDSIDSPFGELNEEFEIESEEKAHSKILIQDQEEIEECSEEESARVMLFDTQNSKRNSIILRKMSSNESFTNSLGSPIKHEEDSMIEMDASQQLYKYSQCMEQQIIMNRYSKVNFGGLQNIKINQKTQSVIIPANIEIPLSQFKNEHANAIDKIQRLGPHSMFSPRGQLAIQSTEYVDLPEDQQLIVPLGYHHLDESKSQKQKLDYPPIKKLFDLDLSMKSEDEEGDIDKIQEISNEEIPKVIESILEIDFQKSDEKKNQSQIFKNKDRSNLSPIQAKSDMNSSFIFGESALNMDKSIYQPYQRKNTPIDSPDAESKDQPQYVLPMLLKNLTPPNHTIQKYSSISEDSPLQQILDNGRFKKKFKDRIKIGEGGFGKVYKAKYHVDQKVYAIKVVRLHIQKNEKLDPLIEIYQHRVYRELQAAARITSENIVRYFNSWFEELEDEDKQIEIDYQKNYVEDNNKQTLLNEKRKLKKKLSSISSGVSSKSKSKSKLRRCMYQKNKLNFGSSDSKQGLRSGLSIQLTKLKKNQIIPELKNEETDEEFDVVQHSKYTHSTSKEEEKKESNYSKRTRSSKKLKDNSVQRSELSKTSKESRSKRRAISIHRVEGDSSASFRIVSETSKSNDQSSSDDDSSSSSSDSSSSNSESSNSKTSVANSKAQSSKQTSQSKGLKSSEVSESKEEYVSSIVSGSEFSKLTLNNFLKKKQEFQSVNMMIQMEFCTGESLEKYLSDRNQMQGQNLFKRSQTDEDRLIDRQYNLQIFSQMINGMVEVHKNNVLHRDLKPENIFINKNGNTTTAKIGDFGLARQLNSQNNQNDLNESSTDIQSGISPSKVYCKGKTNQTQFSSIAGTEAYMAPEIKSHYLNGTRPEKFNDIEINKRQDIFQLGLILYEMSFKMKTNMQRTVLFRKLLNERQFDPQCPLIMDEHIEYELIQRMTEIDPKDRPKASDIQKDWIPKWRSELVAQTTNQMIHNSICEAVQLSKNQECFV